ncbi:hypothetical protein VTN77DRAFT_769 [Rasamsonia byssochlamydoides]|uniref:uncharacterized protein n=1 Tax=Rasamsonia byssochlamydoides TaxID=89139 RepID=UPI00374324DF
MTSLSSTIVVSVCFDQATLSIAETVYGVLYASNIRSGSGRSYSSKSTVRAQGREVLIHHHSKQAFQRCEYVPHWQEHHQSPLQYICEALVMLWKDLQRLD